MAESIIKEYRDKLETFGFALSGKAVTAGNVSDYDFNVYKAGYQYLGALDWAINAGGTCSTVYVCNQGNNIVRVRIRNNGSSSQTPSSITLYGLYRKL